MINTWCQPLASHMHVHTHMHTAQTQKHVHLESQNKNDIAQPVYSGFQWPSVIGTVCSVELALVVVLSLILASPRDLFSFENPLYLPDSSFHLWKIS